MQEANFAGQETHFTGHGKVLQVGSCILEARCYLREQQVHPKKKRSITIICGLRASGSWRDQAHVVGHTRIRMHKHLFPGNGLFTLYSPPVYFRSSPFSEFMLIFVWARCWPHFLIEFPPHPTRRQRATSANVDGITAALATNCFLANLWRVPASYIGVGGSNKGCTREPTRRGGGGGRP